LKRAAVAGAALLVGLGTGRANAHGMLQGVGDFYAGLLHPVVVPAEALALVAVGLLLGSSGLAACRLGLPALVAGLAAGLAIGRHVPIAAATPLLLAIALVGAALVAAGLRLPPQAAAGLALLGGAAVGIDAQPEAEALPPVLVASGATLLGGAALATVVVSLALGRTGLWQRVAVRTAGSWITASTVLYFTWLLVPR
jgi:hypothetical protein